ncbi:MAG: SHOCT domain-containing protein, partial [Bacteroidota bacterium]
YQEARENGAFGSDMVGQELRRSVLEPILRELDAEMKKGGDEGWKGSVFAMGGRIVERLRKFDEFMLRTYQLEDEWFRMATYLRRRSQGASAQQAAIEARDQFINYDIRAPWLNAARRSVLPFIGYTYRSVPIIARTVTERPWKVAKYIAIAHAVNALGYALAESEYDEDEERRSLRIQEQGYTWLMTPRLIRLPMLDDYENPMFLDVRRWIPAGDVFDTNVGQSTIPVPSWLQFGGPLQLGFELALNRQAFTGQDIVDREIDTVPERFGKTFDYLWRSWMPSAAWIPGSWYWDKIGNAAAGATDFNGRPYSISQAALNSVGLKVKPQDVEGGMQFHQFDFQRRERALQAQLRKLDRQFDRGLISQEEFERQLEITYDKLDRNEEEFSELTRSN